MRPLILAAASLAAALPFRPAAAQRYVAATNQTVVSTTQETTLGDTPSHAIYVENHSTVPVTVFSVTLSRCENVRQSCYPRATQLRVRPGGRELATRVEPRNREQGFTYYFSFGWHPDSGAVAAVAAMATAGNTRAQEQLDGYRRADSLARADRLRGVRVRELTRDDFAALAGRAVRLRTSPDSLLLAPGERADIDHVLLLVTDSTGAVLGRTRWIRWQGPPSGGVVRFTPPTRLEARNLGRAVMRFGLADQAQELLGRALDEVEVPVRVGYAPDPHAPAFAGVATDVDRAGAPLACADVALEDSAANVMARGRTDARGAYRLAAPRPGAYRVRVEARGWSPVYGPVETAGRDTTVTRELPVRFTEELLAGPRFGSPWGGTDEFEHASVAAFSTGPIGAGRAGAAAAPQVALGGSPSVPVLGIVTRGPGSTTWMQFVVDPAGRVDLSTLSLAGGTSAGQAAALRAVLPRLRFSPARDAGRPTCELVRMQARFGAP